MSIEGDRAIEQHLAQLSREEIAGAQAAFPAIGRLVSGYSWVRVLRLSSFWRSEKDQSETGAFEDAAQDLMSGFHGAKFNPSFLILGLPNRIEVWCGLANPVDAEALPSALRGSFADIRLTNSGTTQPEIPDALEHGVLISGIPTWKRPEQKEQPRADQIERLCRALYGQIWCYAIFAQPQTSQRTREQISKATHLASDIQARFLLTTNAADQNNRTAKRLTELIDENLERLENGRSSGMWLYSGYLFVTKPEALSRAESILVAAFSGEDSSPVPLRTHRLSSSAASLAPEPITSAELAALISFPREEYSGYEIIRRVRYGIETNQDLTEADKPVLIGHILDRGQPVGRSLQIARNDLTKHGLIVGVTGAGKTNTCFSLLEQVWNDGQGVPFMVIESAKSEYRALLNSPRFSGLRVFTVGDETISPLRLNPFDVPKGILIQAHIDFLQALFAAAFVLYPPMPYVLAMSIQRVYEDKGWDLAANENRRGPGCSLAFPTLDDLIQKVTEVSDAMGYEGEIRSNIKAGLEGRLNQLRIGGGKGIMLNCRESMPASELFEKPCLLELKQLVNDEEKAFLIGLLLIRLHEHYESQGRIGDGKLRHITLIEEAHRLLKNTQTTQGGDSANPQGKAIEVFANLLAEIRAFGEGIFMAEQIPTKLAPEALKNTNLKLVHRLVAKDDREAVGATMNLDEDQIQSLTTLPAGQAVAYMEGLQKPVLIQVPLTDTKCHSVEMSAQSLRKHMQPFWQENQRLRVRYDCCLTCESHGAVCGRPLSFGDQEVIGLQHLWTAMRLMPDSLQKVWQLWASEVKQRSTTNNSGSPFCRAQAWFSPFIARRAENLNWPLKGTSQVLASITETLRALSIENDWHPPLKILRQLLERFDEESSQGRPYLGCSACPKPCTFAFEVNTSLAQQQAEEFVLQFKEKSQASLEMARMAAKRWTPSDTGSHHSTLAYCFAVTSLNRTCFLPTERQTMLQKFQDGLLRKP